VQVIDCGLVGTTDFLGHHESRRCSRDTTYPESYITKYTSIRREIRRKSGNWSHSTPLATEQQLHRDVQRFRGGLVSKAHRLLRHSTQGLRVIKKKRRRPNAARRDGKARQAQLVLPSRFRVEPHEARHFAFNTRTSGLARTRNNMSRWSVHTRFSK